VSLTLRHERAPGAQPRPRHVPEPPPRPPLLVLTPLRAGTGEHLHQAARLARSLDTGLRLAYCADPGHPAPGDPLARLQQRARALRRRHALAVDVVDTPVRQRAELLRLARSATLTCLVDAGPAPHGRGRGLAERLLTPLLRARTGPVWVIRRAPTNGNGHKAVHCLTRLDPAESALLPWARVFAAQRPLRLVHVLHTWLPPDDPNDSVALTVFDHMLRERRVQAHRAIEALAEPLRTTGCAPGHTVLFGDVPTELEAHLARSAPGTLVMGHTPRPWWPLARPRARQLLALADDTVIVPLPAPSLREALSNALRRGLDRVLGPT